MDKLELLKVDFLEFLESKICDSEERIKGLIKEDLKDEANLEKITLNIVKIFKQMFNVSYNKIVKDKKGYEDFKNYYLKYFNTIPASWKEKREKDEKFGNGEGVIIENLKLSMADTIEEKFLGLYEKYEI
ncbi:hypothetical protein [Clostridium sp.]|uniref:hypothetical protein n=1 Tax=Clostridium sp. TaxID=1506 RepID=UPI00346405FC